MPTTIELVPPPQHIRLTLVLCWMSSGVADRVGVQVLALALAWPDPPWLVPLRETVVLASNAVKFQQESLKHCKSDEEKEETRSLLKAAMAQQRDAEAALELVTFQLRDLGVDGQAAIRLVAPHLSLVTAASTGAQLLTGWAREMAGPPEEEVERTINFSIPPPAQISGRGSNSPGNSGGMPSSGSP